MERVPAASGRMSIVIDASAAIRLMLTRPRIDSLRDLVDGDEIHTVTHFDIECISGLRNLWIRQSLSDEAFIQACDVPALLPVLRHPIHALTGRIAELRHNATAYDAAYIALAEAFGAPLLTDDRRLAATPGARCTFRQLP